MIIPEWVIVLAQIGIIASLVWLLYNMPTPGIDSLLAEIYSSKAYMAHGLKSESKCSKCRTWAPIKELKKWDGMCHSCYIRKLNRRTEK